MSPTTKHAGLSPSTSSPSSPSPSGTRAGGQRRQDHRGGPRMERSPPSSVSRAGDRSRRRRRNRRAGPGQNRISGSGRCLPAPPRATPVGLSVATWTSQDGTELPRFYFPRKPWGDQRRPEPGQALDRVPWPFRGRTVTEMDARAHGACLPYRPGDVFCRVCGGLLLHGDGHDRSLFHRIRAGGGDGDIIGPRRVDDPAEHPDAIRCFGARLARDPVFAAAALAAAGLQGVAVSAPANVRRDRQRRPPRTRPGPADSRT
ncbi:hypothetical protein HPB47_025377 [Ixodes persulcatus]|uniref:Uncharacterized protein n=1 Tax=Ixodes persulcatus TaxID=34615 RepID=A0AC60Q211_IXOPE|nr:hypothetical protein HPB47_025377 [Ixodes persulcatus]